MKRVIAATSMVLALLLTACDKPDKAAGEQQGFGINKAASGTPTRASTETNTSGNGAAQAPAPATEKPR